MARDSDEERDAEARRILDRISRESDGGSLLTRATSRLRRHVTAKDAEAEDAVDYWGTRIGRILGLILVAACVIWLISFLARSA